MSIKRIIRQLLSLLLTVALSLVAIVIAPPPAHAAIAFVQTTDVTSANPAATSITSSAFGSSLTAGDLIAVAVSWNQGSVKVCSVTDTASNTYVEAVHRLAANTQGLSIWYAKNINSGASVTVTANYGTVADCTSSNASFRKIQAQEYSGLDTSSPLDVTANNEGVAAANATSTAATTTVADELIFGAALHNNIASYTAGSGFTVRGTQNFFGVEDKIVSATGSYEANWTNAADDWVAEMATFKIAGAPSSPVQRRIFAW